MVGIEIRSAGSAPNQRPIRDDAPCGAAQLIRPALRCAVKEAGRAIRHSVGRPVSTLLHEALCYCNDFVYL